MFNTLLLSLVLFLCIVVFFGFLNEKLIKLPTEIALLFAGLILSVVFIIGSKEGFWGSTLPLPEFLLEDFLVEGVLCFMLFAGACRLRYCDLKSQFKLIGCLAIITTILAAFLYGALSYGLGMLLGLPNLNFSYCLLLGAIISPTDPIAAMSILRKVGLPEDIALTIEGESLFNDGVGVALFVVISGMVGGSGAAPTVSGFMMLLFKELFGAALIAVVISFVLYQLFVRTKDIYRQVFISLLAVSASYVICEEVGCSPAIAAVVCGIFFATFMDHAEQKNPEEFLVYRNFWSVVDSFLNSILYVLLGLTFINIFIYTEDNVKWILVAIVCNVIARYVGVLVSAIFIKEKPQNYKVLPFTNLLTWAGLKGALCLALAMQTSDIVPEPVFDSILICTFAVVIFTTVGQGLTIGKYFKSHKPN